MHYYATSLVQHFAKMLSMPKIVCLCGSTKFYKEFQIANFQETMKGNIVLSVGFYAHAQGHERQMREHGQVLGITPEDKIKLDALHKKKIDLCDEILVLNVGDHIGESTKSEILYAIDHNKPVRYLEAHV